MGNNRIAFLSVFGVSLLFGLLTLGIAIKKKFYKQLLSEFMIYVMVSESLYAISRFLSLGRKEENEVLGNNLIPNMIQIFSSVGCDICTLLSTLLISFKIIDGILNESNIFSRKGVQVISRLIIFLFSFVLALITCFLQVYHFKDDLFSRKLCNVLSCQLSPAMNDYVVYFIIALTFLILAVIVAAIIYLKVRLHLLKRKSIMNEQVSSNINTMQCKLWIYPIVSCAFWAWRFIYQLAHSGTIPDFIIWLYSISNSLRTSIYAIVFILSNNELMLTFRSLFFCCKKPFREAKIIETSVEKTDSDDIMIESQLMNNNDD